MKSISRHPSTPRRLIIVFWMMFLFLFSTVVIAEIEKKEDAEDIGRLKEHSEQIRTRLDENRKNLDQLTKEEQEILDRLDETDRSLERARKRASALQADIMHTKKEIRKYEKLSESLTRRIGQDEAYAQKRLASLYKLERIGSVNLLASADTVNDLLRMQTYLKYILENDQFILNRLETNKQKLSETLASLRLIRQETTTLMEIHSDHEKNMADQKKKKETLLDTIRGRKSFTTASIHNLEVTSKALAEKIEALNEAGKRKRDSQAKKSKKPRCDRISAFQGLLKSPVKGKIIHYFGQFTEKEFNTRHFRSGIDIRAEKGEPIRAVFSGTVCWSDWLKGYGNLIIIDHGNSYHTLYAHTEEVFKQVGDAVTTHEVIATVGDTGSWEGPMLHFEIRCQGKPLDPMKWLKSAS